MRPNLDLLTAEDVARLFSTSVRTVRRMTAAGAIPYYRVGPRAVRYRHTDLERWLSSRYVAPVAA